jgi:putative methyltransferase (TIGR04325 family)
MNATLKALAKEWLPPAVLKTLRTQTPWRIRFRGEYPTWSAAQAASSGYSRASILEKVRYATLKVKNGQAIYERDSVLFDRIEYSWPALATLMWSAAMNHGRLNVLDFGGSLGSSYFQNRKFLAQIADLRWGVVEQPHYVECGRDQIGDERLQFFETIDACVTAIAPDSVLLGSVIQYIESYKPVLRELTAFKPRVVVLDRTIVNAGPGDRIYVQDVPSVVYDASYPCYSISEPCLIGYLDGLGYYLLAEFDAGEFPAVEATGSMFKGYIFTRKTDR